ncbi:exodeoxyribonuclease VII small subunit [Faecalicatena contorta]|uniref:exodeoxyribonuclease VII small subunit n=1 Tax=Faecalicatena contorta TaxID=39482 RepID=UPI001F1D4F6E|nr:exodeoxyribonuclease VII small subunit [Faecalicatena contorta]MCF2682855.1 exodeoxyribonuclease VII small subunit [Faecalicatena contorta]
MVKKANQSQEYTLEELFVQLESTITDMEKEDVSLEDSFQYYHRGMDLLKACSEKIDKVEKKMLVLDEEGDIHEF